MLSDIGELVFSLVVSYMGALEFLYVVRHLYHWSFQHPDVIERDDTDSRKRLQDRLQNTISEAAALEAQTGTKAMQDGVLYKDGFRINPDQKDIDELKNQIKFQEKAQKRRKEIETELERQKKIEEETRKQLKKAEEELERQRQKAEEDARKQEEEKQRILLKEKHEKEMEQQKLEKEQREAEENARRIIEAEKEMKLKRLKQEAEENAKKLIEAEREKELKRRQLEEEREANENTRKLLEAEKEKELRQRQYEEEREVEQNTSKLLETERINELQQRQVEEELEAAENSRKLLLEMERNQELKQSQLEEQRDTEHNLKKLLDTERNKEHQRKLWEEQEQEMTNIIKRIEAEKELELKQRKIDEEALQKLKTANEEVELRQQLALGDEKDAEAFEEPCVKKLVDRNAVTGAPYTPCDEDTNERQNITSHQTVKTQYGQTNNEQYSLKPKPMLFPGLSEESSSIEPSSSSQQSSFSTLPSSSVEASSILTATETPELRFDEYEREAPDGEDVPSLKYSDEYLRSLDGIKHKPLVREDGTGRRRAFKKRRSSGSSTSSRESRASREEELKMFTSLEEEEFETIRKGESEYSAIKYSSEPNLKVVKQHRRHKRSPAKDAKRDATTDDGSIRSSLEMLDEEGSNPWGEVKREHYKDSEFWKREKAISIEEEAEDKHVIGVKKEGVDTAADPIDAQNLPKMSSFEEATQSQHQEAISALQKQLSKETAEDGGDKNQDVNDSKNGNTNNRQTFQELEDNSTHTEEEGRGVLRRSPRIDEMDQYEERWKENTHQTSPNAAAPVIAVDYASDHEDSSSAQISDDFVEDEDRGLLLEGISDFYDFNASINPRVTRSRSRSRARSPATSQPPSVKSQFTPSNVSYKPATLARSKSRSPNREPYEFINRSSGVRKNYNEEPSNHFELLSDLSDFYDFNLRLNQKCYGKDDFKRDREAHRSSVDYIVEELDLKEDRQNSLVQLQVLIEQNESKTSTIQSEDKCEVDRLNRLTQLQQLVDDQSDTTANDQLSAMSRKELIQRLRQTPSTPDYDRSISMEWRDVQRIKQDLLSSGFKRSTYVGESMDFKDQFEDLRQEAREFQRSRSKSRSPFHASDEIEEAKRVAAAKKELQEKILEEITKTTINFQDFSRNINTDFLDNERRASDSALIQKPEILMQLEEMARESDTDLNLEGEEYHHFRRFSLNQEQPVEEYPNDEYVYISQIEVRTLTGTRTWTREDFYGENLSDSNIEFPSAIATSADEVSVEVPDEAEVTEETDGSDDERQTVVEVEDEIDEDISDYNERGPEESQHEQSECEEAERGMDRYAGKCADDWKDTLVESQIYAEESGEEEEGAVGGVFDEDSIQIDQIYDEAIRNRKQSGIQRDYDSILEENQVNDYILEEPDTTKANEPLEDIFTDDNFHDAMWPSRQSRATGVVESSLNFLESERKDNERRYLGDATLSAINSTRLRSRYGIVPSTSFNSSINYDGAEVTEVDLNYDYVPKREYNWRKNFKLDDEENNNVANSNQYLDAKRFSLGGESITLFSQSLEKSADGDESAEVPDEQLLEKNNTSNENVNLKCAEGATAAGMKKKKNKKKVRKSSKGSLGSNGGGDDDYDDYIAGDETFQSISRRSSDSIVRETDSPKRKSRSRKSSKGSITNEDALISTTTGEDYACVEHSTAEGVSTLKKKIKKRKKAKDLFVVDAQIVEERPQSDEKSTSPTANLINPLSEPASSVSHKSTKPSPCEPTKSKMPSTASDSHADSYDILKDGNFYPLF